MSDQRLFSVNKVGLFLDTYAPGTEKRRGESCTIIKATFRIQPFDAKLATAIDQGLRDNSGVRASLFKLSSVEPKPHIERLNFNLSCPLQNMEMFASPDTDESRIAFLQVKIGGTYAHVQKDVDGFAFVFTGAFGPVDRETLHYLQGWYGTQRFVNFAAAEPSLEFSDEVREDDDADDDEPFANRPAPMFDDEEEAAGVTAAKEATNDRKREKAHRYPKRNAKKASKRKT
jgi:hypothetical protein